jgi:hypothetical protein
MRAGWKLTLLVHCGISKKNCCSLGVRLPEFGQNRPDDLMDSAAMLIVNKKINIMDAAAASPLAECVAFLPQLGSQPSPSPHYNFHFLQICDQSEWKKFMPFTLAEKMFISPLAHKQCIVVERKHSRRPATVMLAANAAIPRGAP